VEERQLKILVIDDSPENIVVLRAMMSYAFPTAKVLKALNGKNGLTIAAKEDPDVVLLDMIMPEMDGFKVCRQLKANPLLADIPVVFVTESRSEREHRILALECGGDGFLSKPIDEYELISQIRAMVKIKEANVQKRIERERMSLLTLVKEQTAALKESQVLTIKRLKSLEQENEARKKSERVLVAAQKLANLGSYEYDAVTGRTVFSEEALTIFGVKSEDALNSSEKLLKLVHRDDCEYVVDNIQKLINKHVAVNFSFRTVFFHGEERLLNARMIPRFDENKNYVGNFGTIQDITRIRKTEDDIRYLSYHDHLTGLFNRRFYEEVLTKLDREENLPLTLVMGDVNGLKMVNDSFGHEVGDELIRKASEVIKNGCRDSDVVARLGGDEFVIILPQTDAETAAKIISRMESQASEEKINGLKLSIAFGTKTKIKEEESIKKILETAEDEMYRNKLFESAKNRNRTIDLIMNTLYEKSNGEMVHSNRVGLICEKIGLKMQLDKNEIKQIRTAGLFHDIGKMGIDAKILNKPGSLCDDEWKEIRRHPEIGYRILSSFSKFSDTATYILEHHERWDGGGYPKGLKGEEISLQSRIVAVADSFDAMTSDRVYRKALPQEEALAEIERCAGTHFDPTVARLLIEIIILERTQKQIILSAGRSQI
jgi:diguanylate cyclase (GGDEF)-like protein/PAS domain S-box-containing protein